MGTMGFTLVPPNPIPSGSLVDQGIWRLSRAPSSSTTGEGGGLIREVLELGDARERALSEGATSTRVATDDARGDGELS